MKQLPDYTLIDQKATGERLKRVIRESGYRVSEIQQFLSFSGPQPIYRWFRGEALPSLHHLCALSGLLDVPVDDLLVRGQDDTANSDCEADYAFAKSYNCYSLMSGDVKRTETVLNAGAHVPLRIDFEKARRTDYAVGMYGIAILSRIYANVAIPG
ncbi:MAG: helix-turn-helix domain-containing protein [Lachnospiraceae bacterium]|nr:helix-turn-helix domain-containing protein [Lachnospiraceae bacterium]